MTKIDADGITFNGYTRKQTKAICSVDGVVADNDGNIPVNFTSINTNLDDLETRLDNIGDGSSSYIL